MTRVIWMILVSGMTGMNRMTGITDAAGMTRITRMTNDWDDRGE